jgi:hypothetical protein
MSLSAPEPEILLDHTGALRPSVPSPLTAEQIHRGVCFHEAGHAVVDLAFGFHLDFTQAYRWTQDGYPQYTGYTQVEVGSAPALRLAVGFAAGEVADLRHLRERGLWSPETAVVAVSDHDRDQALDCLADCGFPIAADHTPRGGMAWSEVLDTARHVVDLLWPLVTVVADALYAHPDGLLTGEQVAALVHLPNPPVWGDR